MGRAALLTAFSIPAAICALWTVFAGKDVNWDLLNYHYYLPYELLGGRLGQDFFAASAQSYLNPVGYVPFYLMVSSGWHSVVVSLALAVAHSASIGLLYLIAWKLFAHLPRRERVVMSCLATALGIANAVFWAMVGSSFLDPLLLPMLLGGLLLLLEGPHRAALRATLAGALFGAAAGLKYSNAIFGLAALPLVLAMPGVAGTARLRTALGYAGGGTVALGLFAGPWFALMLREFGNPVFPLLNAWFQSPYAPPDNALSERFMPEGLAAALTFPFRMAMLDRSLYAEIFAPDIRCAALVGAAIALPAVVMTRRGQATKAFAGADWRVFSFLALAGVLWLATSANARYGLVVLLLAGVCLARVTERLLPSAMVHVVLAVILAVQVATSMLASPSRWFIAEPWSRHWLPYAVPERARHEPALYLTLESLPMAVLAPFVHPASSFVNFRGQRSIAPDSARLASLLERHRGRVRALGRALELVEGKPRHSEVRAYDATLARIGYRVDATDCFTIAWRPDDDDPLSRAANWFARTAPTSEPLSAVSCALRPTARDPALAEKERHISALFDRMQKACPGVFRGQTAVTEPLGSGWSRHYVGLDARLEAYPERVILNRYRTGQYVALGRLSDWEREPALVPQSCQ